MPSLFRSTLASGVVVAFLAPGYVMGEGDPQPQESKAVEAPRVDKSSALSLLKEAASYFDEMAQLPESTWIGRDKESANADINELIEEVIQVLEVPELTEYRSQYRAVEQRIREENDQISELKEKRILAPQEDASTLTRWTPTETLKNFTASTRGDYDILIEARQSNIESYRQSLEALRETMSARLDTLGIYMPADQLELWMTSAIGDDVITMSVVFNSIRTVTEDLSALTAESGENLEFAKRYYGMVVILHKLVVHMQETFIDRVGNTILPRLDTFREEADAIIAEARRLMKDASNPAGLEQSIEANKLTNQAIDLYERIVTSQRNKVQEALEISRHEEKVAIVNYRTVSLSSVVASLIRNGLDTFETLSNLQVPDTAEFQNAEIREEFRKLTERIESGQ